MLMKLPNWAAGLANQLVAWLVRPRNLGIVLLTCSSGVLIAVVGGFSFKAQGVAGIVEAFEFSTGEGLSASLTNLVVCLACVTWVVGLGVTGYGQWREWAEADARRVLVLELRGLVDTSDYPLLKAVPRSIVGRRVDCLVNVRAWLSANPPCVDEALKELGHVQREIRRARGDTARENVRVVAGGIMQVPLLFYAGTILEDEGDVLLFDWERTIRKWKPLAAADDESRFSANGLDDIEATEVVLAVSASYMASLENIEATFPGLQVVHLARANPEPNSLWSEETQAALTQQFLQTMGTLANRGVKTVHLVLAAPSSLAIRFGMAYDHRNMPNLRCYQRECDHVPPYPWSVQMPTATQSVAYLPTPNPTVVAAA